MPFGTQVVVDPNVEVMDGKHALYRSPEGSVVRVETGLALCGGRCIPVAIQSPEERH